MIYLFIYDSDDSANISMVTYHALDTILSTWDSAGTEQIKSPNAPMEFTF